MVPAPMTRLLWNACAKRLFQDTYFAGANLRLM